MAEDELVIVALAYTVPAAPLPGCTATDSWEGVQVASLAGFGVVVVEVAAGRVVVVEVVDDAPFGGAAEELPLEEHAARASATASNVPTSSPRWSCSLARPRLTRIPPAGTGSLTSRSPRA